MPTQTSGGASSAVRLHSRHDPLGEANRYLDARAEGKRPSALVSIAPGLDWLSVAAEARWPAIRCVSLQPDPGLRGLERPSRALRWYPDSGLDLVDFLVGALRDAMDGGLVLAEWRPALAAAPGFADAAGDALKRALAFLSASGASERYWAGRWLRNAARNFLLLDEVSVLERDERPLLLAAAGPSLEACLDTLGPLAGRIRVWALAASAEACALRGFEPELLIATDGGAWNLLHFGPGPLQTPVAAPLSARIRADWLEAGLLAPLDCGAPREAQLLRALGVEPPAAAPHGTAAGTAASLAVALGTRALVVAGFDLAADDLAEHARPYAFDERERRSATRQAPAHARAFARVAERYPLRGEGRWRGSRAFSAYASAGLRCPVALSVSPSPFVREFRRIDLAEARRLLEAGQDAGVPERGRLRVVLPRAERERVLERLVGAWVEACARGMAAALEGGGLAAETRDLLWAFAAQACASFVAECARGTASQALAETTLVAVEAGAARLLEELLS